MNQATTLLYEREGQAAREREERARGGDSAYGRAAEALARRANVSLTAERKQQAGTALHWATGIMAGMKYAVLRRQWPDVAAGFGLAYGFSFFMVMDELMNPVLGFTPGPLAFPWQAHARGLAGHAVFGTVAEGTLRLIDCE
jgi:uncharacterized membrane protein YagU involved in acid resistance